MRSLIVAAGLAIAVVGPAPVFAGEATEKLDTVLAIQPDHMKARYQYRNPKETLEFLA